MAETYTFPTDFPEPNIASTSGAGDSYKDKLQDSTISVTSDANYKKTRPRTTRMVETWTYAWVGVSKADFDKLKAFFRQVGTYQQFAWTDWNTKEAHVVRFIEALEWQENHPYGWQGVLKFEEV